MAVCSNESFLNIVKLHFTQCLSSQQALNTYATNIQQIKLID